MGISTPHEKDSPLPPSAPCRDRSGIPVSTDETEQDRGATSKRAEGLLSP